VAQQAFEEAEVDAIGLVGVGDADDGLPSDVGRRLLATIKDRARKTELVVHACATQGAYMLLSKADSNAKFSNVRVETGFVSQAWRKALRATLTLGSSSCEVDFWLVHLASSQTRRVTAGVRQEMLNHLATGKPAFLAGDIDTPELVLRHWMLQNKASNPSMASSGVVLPVQGDWSIATKMVMWTTEHEIGRSFQGSDDGVSNAHDMVCVALSHVARNNSVPIDAAEPGDVTSAEEESPMADAVELGPLEGEASLRQEAERIVHQTQERLLEAEASSVDFGDGSGDEREASSASEEHRSRSRTPRRTSEEDRRWRRKSRRDSSARVDVQKESMALPMDFVVAMQDMFFPVEWREFNRPANILRYESSLGPSIRMASLDATVQIAYFILRLRRIALDRRVADAKSRGTSPVDVKAPLTYDEVGIVMEHWKSKFMEQTLTREQAKQDDEEGCSSKEKRSRMRGRWYAYVDRALGNRKLGMALITLGFEVDLKKLATAYARAIADGDASSLPSRKLGLRQRTLSMRAWYRWGHQLKQSVDSKEVTWDSLGPTAQDAYRGFVDGWSAKECDRLTREYGHGMLRSGSARGSYVGQQARGSVVDRLCLRFF